MMILLLILLGLTHWGAASSKCQKMDSWCEGTVNTKSTTFYTLSLQRRLLNGGQLSFYFETSPPKNIPPLLVTVVIESHVDLSTLVPHNFTVRESNNRNYSFVSNHINKTLCPVDVQFSKDSPNKKLKVGITVIVSSPARPQPQNFSFLISKTQDFYVLPRQTREFRSSPFSPKLFRLEVPGSALLSKYYYRVTLESADAACYSVSYQTRLCPKFVYDSVEVKTKNPDEYAAVPLLDLFSQDSALPVRTGGEVFEQQTADLKSGLMLDEELLRNSNGGINVVIVVKPNDRTCRLGEPILPRSCKPGVPINQCRNKSMTLRFERLDVTVSSFMRWFCGTFAFFLAAGLAFVTAYWASISKLLKATGDGRTGSDQPSSGYGILSEEGAPSYAEAPPKFDGSGVVEDDLQSNSSYATALRDPARDAEQSTTFDDTLQEEAPSEPEDSPRQSQDETSGHEYKAEEAMFCLACILSLPFVRNVIFNYKIYSFQDSCYFNELCNYKIGRGISLSTSNIVYVLLGLTYVVIVRLRKLQYLKIRPQLAKGCNATVDDYLLGISLALQGAMSFVYHICPNAFHLPIDTNFMQVMIALTVCKLFRCLRKYPVDGIEVKLDNFPIWLCVATSCNMMVTALPPTLYLKSVYAVLNIVVSSVLVFGLYETGPVGNRTIETPLLEEVEKMSFAFLARSIVGKIKNAGSTNLDNAMGIVLLRAFSLFMVFAWGLIGGVNWNLSDVDDVASLPLFVVSSMSLVLVPFVAYVSKKLTVANSLGLWMLRFTLLMAGIFAGFALYFYNEKESDFSISKAESRRLNRPCGTALSIYDNHDVWHFFSAFGCFFSFMAVTLMEDAMIVNVIDNSDDGLVEDVVV